MAKHGDNGLGYEIVKGVISGEMTEPITTEKVRSYCKRKGIHVSGNNG